MNSALHRSPSADDRLRAEQNEEARRLEATTAPFGEFRSRRTLTATRPVAPSRPVAGVKPRPALKGHEQFLKALELSGANVIIEKMNGEKVEGLVRHSDKYTVTMRAGGEDRVIFKHDISEFKTTTPRPGYTPAADAEASEGQRV